MCLKNVSAGSGTVAMEMSSRRVYCLGKGAQVALGTLFY